MLIKPTVGRVVWLWRQPGQEQPNVAFIAYVHSDTMINIAYFDERGAPDRFTSMPLWHGEGDRPTVYPFCEWMPYQKGQAAKTEQLLVEMHGKPKEGEAPPKAEVLSAETKLLP